MKTAVCTHCGKAIESNPTWGWIHTDPTPGLKEFACRVIKTATPQRGTIEKS